MKDTPKLFVSEFLKAIGESLNSFQRHGARSNRKLIPLHSCLARFISAALGSEYSVRSLGIGDDKEEQIEGQYYTKRVDIAVIDGNKPIAAIGLKFVTSNYKQNNVNYFENMLGETVNLRRKNYGYAQVIVIRKEMPYKLKSGKTTKIERISEKNLRKYVQLVKDKDYPHRPDLMSIAIVDFPADQLPRLAEGDSDLGLSAETIRMLQNELSLANFFIKFPHLCQFKR